MPTRTRRPKRKLKTAKIIIYERHAEMRMLGFELEDLDEIKERVSMRWDRDEQVWLLHRLDIDHCITVMEGLGFIVRTRDDRE